jgi:tetratricopeptide (TPR) repeat protein
MAWIKKTPAENGAPSHFLSASYRPAKGLPATLESFRMELGRQGFDHAQDIYAAMQKESPNFKLDESTVDSWGNELMTDNQLPEAIDIFLLNAKNYPDSGSVYDSLGEAYMQSGQKQLAIDNYKKSLEKDPSNNARQKLKDLVEPPAGAK